MELLYLWVRNYKNINNVGFNLSSKITFETIIKEVDSEDNIYISLISNENDEITKFFPSNIVDVKAIIGENGAGKTNFIFSLLEIFLDKRNKLNGFLVTTENIIVRDKVIFTNAPRTLFNKPIKQIYPEDIYNFDNNPFKNKLTRNQVFNKHKNNLMETYFENEYVIYYSPFISTDNIHNIDGIENDYSRWENEKPNFINISTESILISDYQNLNNNEKYLITGESELLAYKYEESKRILDFLKIANDFNFEIKFQLRSISVEFTGFGERFWKSIDKVISKNTSSFDQKIEKILKFETQSLKASEEEFFKDLAKSITYCFLSFELKNYFNFSREEQIPIERLVNNLQENYNSDLDNFEALFEYIKKTKVYSGNENYIITQLEQIKNYFIDKFKSKEIICDGIYGFVIPEKNINNIIGDFLKSPLRNIEVGEDRYIVLNLFGFNFNGLSSGERSFLSLFSRINYYKNTHISKNKNILFIIDEGEVGFHPQWQKKYLKILLDFFEKFFPNNRVQLILSTHSPFIVSDLPKENIIFLKKDQNNMTEISDVTNHDLTFGANIYDLLANDFFLQDGFIGDFAKAKIAITLNWLKTKANALNKSRGNTSSDFKIDPNIEVLKFNSDEQEFKYHRKIIDMIGEPLVKNKLINMFIDYVNDDSNFLKDELEKAKEKVLELEKRIKP